MLVSNWLITKLKIVLTTVYICKQFLSVVCSCCCYTVCIRFSFYCDILRPSPPRFSFSVFHVCTRIHGNIPRYSRGEYVCSSILPPPPSSSPSPSISHEFNHFIFIFVSFYTIHVSCLFLFFSFGRLPSVTVRCMPAHRIALSPLIVSSLSFPFTIPPIRSPHPTLPCRRFRHTVSFGHCHHIQPSLSLRSGIICYAC